MKRTDTTWPLTSQYALSCINRGVTVFVAPELMARKRCSAWNPGESSTILTQMLNPERHYVEGRAVYVHS